MPEGMEGRSRLSLRVNTRRSDCPCQRPPSNVAVIVRGARLGLEDEIVGAAVRGSELHLAQTRQEGSGSSTLRRLRLVFNST